MGGDAVEESVEIGVGVGESPIEGLRGGVVAGLKGQHPLGQGIANPQPVGDALVLEFPPVRRAAAFDYVRQPSRGPVASGQIDNAGDEPQSLSWRWQR
jgi:hypothetical protein